MEDLACNVEDHDSEKCKNGGRYFRRAGMMSFQVHAVGRRTLALQRYTRIPVGSGRGSNQTKYVDDVLFSP